MALELLHRVACNFGIQPPRNKVQLDIVGHRTYAIYSFGCLLGLQLHPQAGYAAGECDNAIHDSHSDIGFR